MFDELTVFLIQEAALQGSVIAMCLEQLNDKNALLRQWLGLCLGKVRHRPALNLLHFNNT